MPWNRWVLQTWEFTHRARLEPGFFGGELLRPPEEKRSASNHNSSISIWNRLKLKWMHTHYCLWWITARTYCIAQGTLPVFCDNLCECVCSVAQLCPILCNPMDPTRLLCSWNFQARILKWVALSFSRGSSQSRDWIWVLWWQAGSFTTEPPEKPMYMRKESKKESIYIYI